MAVHKISVKQLVSRIRQVFPDTPENYVLNLVNDALVEIGLYNTKPIQAKMSTVANQMWDYIQIPRLIDKNILLMDATSESELENPDDK